MTVNQNSLNYGGVKIVFHRSVVKACFVFRNPPLPDSENSPSSLTIEDTVRSAGIRLQSVLSGAPLVHIIAGFQENVRSDIIILK